MTGKDALLETDLLEKAVTIKRFEYSALGKKFKKQTSASEKWYQKFESNKKEENILKCPAKSNLLYSKEFCKYRNINEFFKLLFILNYLVFHYDTQEIKPNNKAQEKDIEKRKVVN